MSIFDLAQLSKKTQNKLEKVGLISCNKVMDHADFELRKCANLTSKECLQVRISCSKLLLKSFIDSNERLQVVHRIGSLTDVKRITLDCDILNMLLRGGLPTRGITEIHGESGAGKTQICLQLCLTVQYPVSDGGLGAGAVYICTEDKFPVNRLERLSRYFPRSKSTRTSGVLDKIYVDHIADASDLKECVYFRLPRLMSNRAVGLIIVDSIAAIYRVEFDRKHCAERAASMRDTILQLGRLSRKFGAAVVCVNQVSDAVESGRGSVPALGLAWANLLTTRLRVTRHPTRSFTVVSAPDLPPTSCFYSISDQGVFGSLSLQH